MASGKRAHTESSEEVQSRDRRQTEDRLLRAALELFSARGFDGVPVKAIAEAAGANVSLINRYFGGKEGLLLAVFERFLTGKRNQEPGYESQPNLRLEIFEYLRFRLREDNRQEPLIRLLLLQLLTNAGFRRRVRHALGLRSDENFRARLEELRRKGRFPPEADTDALFGVVSLFSFSANVIGHQLLGRSISETEALFRIFADSVAAGNWRRDS